MATAQSRLVDAIKRIAGVDPETLALLKDIQKRGGIDGIKTELGGDGGTGANEDCCKSSGGGNPAPNPGEDGWTDCLTGQPVTFDPNGFPRPETCKECAPDPEWEQGFYWIAPLPLGAGDANGSTPTEVYNQFPDTYTSGYTATKDRYVIAPSGLEGVIYYKQTIPPSDTEYFFPFSKVACGASTEDYCTITEPPEICGDWAPDGTTNYALVGDCITASSCDPEASQQSQQCNECITICNSAGEQHEICVGPDGSYLDNGLYGAWSGYY